MRENYIIKEFCILCKKYIYENIISDRCDICSKFKQKAFYRIRLCRYTDWSIIINDNEIVFFTTSPIGEKSVVDGCKVYSYSNMSVIPYILKVGLKKYANVMKMKCSFKEKIKNARSMIIAEYFESIIEKKNRI